MSIQVKNVTHIYSEGMPYESIALEDVSFFVEDNEFLGIIGHTGSGKSTLVQHLNGLLKPKTGAIFIGDVDITGENILMRDIRRKIGLVFQYPEYQLFEETVHKDVAFGPTNLGLSKEEIDARVVEAIGLVGMDYKELADRSPFELSGGQKRRIAIAGVIAMKPEVLILDEPTAGLDPRAHKEILDMIRTIHQREKNITLLISHNMSDIATLSDKILVMEKGHVAMMGTPREIFSRDKELKSMGLALPPAAEFMNLLKQRGMIIENSVLTKEEALQELLYQLKDKRTQVIV